MESDEIEAILAQARQFGQIGARVYREVTGEDLELESAIRHYPVLALGVVAGSAALAGWWLGRKSAKQLPDKTRRVTQQGNDVLGQLEARLPETMDRVRKALPEVIVSDEMKQAAKRWLSQSIEPRLREKVDEVSERLDTAITDLVSPRRKDGGQRDVRLEDPEP